MFNIIRAKEYMLRLRLISYFENWYMFSSLRFKENLSQIMHAVYPIVCFPVLVRCIPGIVFVYITGILKKV